MYLNSLKHFMMVKKQEFERVCSISCACSCQREKEAFLLIVVCFSCGHECCKIGVIVKEKSASQQNKSTPTTHLDNPGSRKCAMSREVEKHMSDMHAKASHLATPSLRNIKVRVASCRYVLGHYGNH